MRNFRATEHDHVGHLGTLHLQVKGLLGLVDVLTVPVVYGHVAFQGGYCGGEHVHGGQADVLYDGRGMGDRGQGAEILQRGGGGGYYGGG